MIAIVSATDVSGRGLVRGPEGARAVVTEYLGEPSGVGRGPQMFLATYPPGSTIKPHFHRMDQFQIFVRGRATMGRESLTPVTIFYTDGVTPYGPIVGGEEGFAYFNLRGQPDLGGGIGWMPQDRGLMVRRPGRALVAHARLRMADIHNPLRFEALLKPQDDGLAVYELVAGSDVRLPDMNIAGGGRFNVVLEGSLAINGRTLSLDSCTFVSPGEQPPVRRAGPEGVHLIEVQLPTP